MENQKRKKIYILYKCDDFSARNNKVVFATTNEKLLVRQVKKMIRNRETGCGFLLSGSSHRTVERQISNFNFYYENYGLLSAIEQCWFCRLQILENGVETL